MKVSHDDQRIFIHPSGARTPFRVQDGLIHGGSQILTADQAIDLAAGLMVAAAMAQPTRTWQTVDNIPLPDTLFARLRIDTWRRRMGLPKSATTGLTTIVVDELNQRSSICHALNKCLGNIAAAMARGVYHAGASDD